MRALSFSKGCYLGQEIVERIRSLAAFTGICGRWSSLDRPRALS